MPDIKLFVCCHQLSNLPEHPLLVPIQVGAALSEKHFPKFLHDDEGENISYKNRSYCELTAQYWAWKNIAADFYGFFHYRRFLYPDFNAKRPYQVQKAETKQLLDKLGYNAGFAQLIQSYDLIMPKGENMFISVQEHYAKAPYHHEKDLETAKEVLLKRQPEMKNAMECYFSDTIHFFGNIYIMRRELFYDYCSWLFPTLNEIDGRLDVSQYSLPELRVDGYLAERLLGVYYTYNKQSLRTLELPRVHFDPNVTVKSRIVQSILPPGTQRRAFVKKLVKG